VVSASQLAELEVESVMGIVLVDPANVPMERFAVASEPLSDVAAKLCGAGNLDMAFRLSLARPIILTLDLRNRSPLECLQVACRAAGWTVRCQRPRHRVTARLSDSVSDRSIWVPELHSQWKAQRPPVEPSMDALHQVVARAARELLERRPAAILEPAAQPASEKK
jgi:hypothetical protein